MIGTSEERSRRMVLDGAVGAYANLALEEALLKENKGLLVRVWGNEKSVIVGRAQLPKYETDLDLCAKERIPVVRRISAGGAVFNGEGNVNWSLFVSAGFSEGRIRYTRDVKELFRTGAYVVTEACSRCGVKTWLDQPSRILSKDGKVSGMAAYVSKDGFLCHGTLLLDANLEEATRLTQPSEAQLHRRYTRSRPMRVANTGIELSSFIASVRGVVAEQVGKELEIDQITTDELREKDALMEKYSSTEWNLGDPFGV